MMSHTLSNQWQQTIPNMSAQELQDQLSFEVGLKLNPRCHHSDALIEALREELAKRRPIPNERCNCVSLDIPGHDQNCPVCTPDLYRDLHDGGCEWCFNRATHTTQPWYGMDTVGRAIPHCEEHSEHARRQAIKESRISHAGVYTVTSIHEPLE